MRAYIYLKKNNLIEEVEYFYLVNPFNFGMVWIFYYMDFAYRLNISTTNKTNKIIYINRINNKQSGIYILKLYDNNY